MKIVLLVAVNMDNFLRFNRNCLILVDLKILRLIDFLEDLQEWVCVDPQSNTVSVSATKNVISLRDILDIPDYRKLDAEFREVEKIYRVAEPVEEYFVVPDIN